MKRLFDLILALIAASLLLVPIVVVAVLVKLTSKGPALYWSDQVGMYNTIFKMPEFRSVELMGYVYMVPYVKNNDEIYLKTIIPSRKMYKHYKG